MIDCSSLFPIQKFDLEIDSLDNRIREQHARVHRLEEEITKESHLADQKRALLQKILLRRRKLETDVAVIQDKIRTSEVRLQSAGMSPNIYVALQKEVDQNKSAASDLESKILEDMEKGESLDKDVAKAEKVLTGRRQQLEDVRQKAAALIQEIAREKDALLAQRRQASLKINGDLLEIYENLRQKSKGKVIWDTESLGCPACGMGLARGFINSLVGVEGAEPCPYCGLLLRWTGILDGLR